MSQSQPPTKHMGGGGGGGGVYKERAFICS